MVAELEVAQTCLVVNVVTVAKAATAGKADLATTAAFGVISGTRLGRAGVTMVVSLVNRKQCQTTPTPRIPCINGTVGTATSQQRTGDRNVEIMRGITA